MTAAARLAYADKALLTATGQRRADLLAKAERLRTQLAGHCTRCGRAAEHLVGGLGSTCVRAS